MTDTERKISEDEDYINIKRYGFSLKKILERYPDECPHKLIAQALMVSEYDVDCMYAQAVQMLRSILKVRE